MLFLLVIFLELVALFISSQFLTKALSQVFYRLTKNTTVTISALSLLFLPGVIIHELAHLLTASLLFVPVGDMEFLPKMQEGGVKMGSVAIGKTDPFRRAVIGVAPILVGVFLLIFLLFYFTLPDTLPALAPAVKYALLFYLVFQLANTMFSSKKDVEGTIETVLAIAIILVIFYFVGFHLPFTLFSQVVASLPLETLRNIAMLLLLPLGSNALVILLANLLLKKTR